MSFLKDSRCFLPRVWLARKERVRTRVAAPRTPDQQPSSINREMNIPLRIFYNDTFFWNKPAYKNESNHYTDKLLSIKLPSADDNLRPFGANTTKGSEWG